MTQQTDLQKLGDATKPYFDQFCAIMNPYRNDLWRYCLKITRSPWDAEDLFQDTYLKLFTSLSALSHRQQPIHPKSFLFRVATNHWIDTCRKRKHAPEEYMDEAYVGHVAAVDPFELHEAFEKLLQYLPPRQIAAIVLIDAFRFTAAEAAEIIGTTEGAVTGLLFRARKKLRQMRDTGDPAKTLAMASANSDKHQDIIQQYVSCFNQRDFNGIAQLLADHAVFSFVAQGSQEYGRDTIMNASHHPKHYENQNLQAFTRELWGKQAVIFANVAPNSTPAQLNEVLSFEIENDKIIKISGYYFCPEFMEAASLETDLPREPWNWAG
ncbi:RNA polymerase sigma factor [Paenibacillus sp. NEAU-GSW1]|uniref:RNA polymerase sigma factor n=1 Tax=Paenibacillus sp. NEAU-GSW1 TaxID=2682486 RepID=UPI00156522CD|nr:RNA polymerase sigma factor [Paenibacillus sp. NEAU-GSW1]